MSPVRILAPLLFVLSLCALPGAARADALSESAAADLLHKRLRSESPQDAALLDAVKGKDIVVVAGSMDHIESVLAAARIRFTLITPAQVASRALTNDQIVMVNCPGTMPAAGVQRIRNFVRAGGLLYTTDWALLNLVQKAFPNTIAHNGRSSGNEVVPVIVDKQGDNLMSRMLLTGRHEPQWWLEGGSYPIRILDAKRVEVLAHSDVMGQRYGASPVVVRFRWDDGQVIHVVSHFVRQLATQGAAVAAGKAVDSIPGLSTKDKEEFKQSAGAAASLGDVASSYAFQKMTSNLVIEKQKRNQELDRAYGMTVSTPLPLAPAASGPAAEGAAPPPVVAAGARLKVLRRAGDRVQVRDDQGNEGFLDAAALQAR